MQPPRGFRFKRDQRLLTGAAYSRVFEKPRRSRDKCFTVLARRTHGDQPARLGLAISKKHCRKATARNRIKRQVRESFRMNQDAVRSLDIVVINQPGATLATKQELKASLERHWRRLSDEA